MLDPWRAWIAAFDAACESDSWDGLADHLAEDVVYAVTGVPFACELRGRDAVIAGFAKSVRGFDRRFDRRGWTGVGVRHWDPNLVTARPLGEYERAGQPVLRFAAYGSWWFRADGRIALMTDLYDSGEADIQAALAWLGEYGSDLDPSYV